MYFRHNTLSGFATSSIHHLVRFKIIKLKEPWRVLGNFGTLERSVTNMCRCLSLSGGDTIKEITTWPNGSCYCSVGVMSVGRRLNLKESPQRFVQSVANT